MQKYEIAKVQNNVSVLKGNQLPRAILHVSIFRLYLSCSVKCSDMKPVFSIL